MMVRRDIGNPCLLDGGRQKGGRHGCRGLLDSNGHLGLTS